MSIICDFTFDSFTITRTRARHLDTGNLNNGTYPVGITFQNVAIASNETAVLSYAIVNAGHGNPDPTFIEKELEGLVSTLAAKGAEAAAKAVGASVGVIVGAEIGTIAIPIIGTALGALTGWVAKEVGRTEFFMPRTKRAVRYAGSWPAPRQGDTPWTPGPLSLPPYVPERSLPSRVRYAAHKPRTLDRSGTFPRLTEIRESGQMQSPLAAGRCLPLVGPELHNKFGVDKTS